MGNRKRCLNLFKSPQGPGAPLGWESAFGEDSGLPTLTLATALSLLTHLLTLFCSRFLLTALLDFTHLQRYRCAGTRSTAVSSTLKI